MTANVSLPRNLTSRQFKGLQKLGDAFIPGDDELPAFSTCGCAEHADRILDHMPDQDRKDLTMLLGIFGWTPGFLVAGWIALLDRSTSLPGAAGNFVRFLGISLKGLVMTLYYSGETGRAYSGAGPHQVLGYEVDVYLDDIRNEASE